MLDLLYTLIQWIYNGIVTIIHLIESIPAYINDIIAIFNLFPVLTTFAYMIISVAVIIKLKRLIL